MTSLAFQTDFNRLIVIQSEHINWKHQTCVNLHLTHCITLFCLHVVIYMIREQTNFVFNKICHSLVFFYETVLYIVIKYKACNTVWDKCEIIKSWQYSPS